MEWFGLLLLLCSGVCGFTLSLVLAHVCRAHADVARNAAPVQLFRLALSFLAAADFRGHVYCFGKEAGVSKTELTESNSALLDAALISRNEAASAAAATPSAAAAAAGVYQEQQMHSGPWGQRELCVGLVEDACLFDSTEPTFNILWRAQLHIKVSLLSESHRLLIYPAFIDQMVDQRAGCS